MKPVVVNVSTGRYVRGQQRLARALAGQADFLAWADQLPPGSPPHSQVPYAFKAFAIQEARRRGYELILWCDACIVPARPLEPLWEQIRRDGYMICKNGWQNGEWTCDAAYADLGISREYNWAIPHVVATTFGLDVSHPLGQACADEYFRLASQTRAFCGPWTNKNGEASADARVLGHRHDQSALAVIRWKLGMQLTECPRVFAYRTAEPPHPETLLLADGNY